MRYKGKRKKKIDPRIDYFAYIESPLWTKRKEEYYKTHKKECQACGSKHDIQLHHMRYGDFGNEPDYALITFCRTCHKDFHEKHATKKDMIRYSLKYVAERQREIKKALLDFGF
jgi:5-methylcytosine-specific restriction endonuclease McrA